MGNSDYYTLLDIEVRGTSVILSLDYSRAESSAELFGDVWTCEVQNCALPHHKQADLKKLVGQAVFIAEEAAGGLHITDEENIAIQLLGSSALWSAKPPSEAHWRSRLERINQDLAVTTHALNRAQSVSRKLSVYCADRITQKLHNLEARIEFHTGQSAEKTLFEKGQKEMLLEVLNALKNILHEQPETLRKPPA